MTELLAVQDLVMHYPIRGGLLLRQVASVRALDGVSFAVRPGETLGLVGESGCGKSTLARTVVGINRATSGQVRFAGENVASFTRQARHAFRRDVQMIFQDPYGSLNPRITIGNIVRRPLAVHGIGSAADRTLAVRELLDRVGLGAWALDRYPHEFSGGQRQRIAIARAIAIRPRVVIADEPVSALDVSVQAQILNLMKDLGQELGMTYLFIAHNLAVVQHMSDRIAVMYLGRIVELAAKEDLFRETLHPYTQALMAANPVPGAGRRRSRSVLRGDVPSPIRPPSGCHFHPRCPDAKDVCKVVSPALINTGTAAQPRLVACHLYGSQQGVNS